MRGLNLIPDPQEAGMATPLNRRKDTQLWRIRSFGVRQLAAAFLPASMLAGLEFLHYVQHHVFSTASLPAASRRKQKRQRAAALQSCAFTPDGNYLTFRLPWRCHIYSRGFPANLEGLALNRCACITIGL